MTGLGWAVLTTGAFAAGWVDAVIGGGGLILIPLIMAMFPAAAPVVALATNKFAACTGTVSAAIALNRKVRVDRAYALAAAGAAGATSVLGARVVTALPADVMRPIVIVLILVAGVAVATRVNFGDQGGEERPSRARRFLSVAAVAGIGVYDGVFGPGTGLFLLTTLAEILHVGFLRAAALTKIINSATNIGALVFFIAAGALWWRLALVLAVANVAGAQLGARTVLAGRTRLLRYLVLGVVVSMSALLAYQQWA